MVSRRSRIRRQGIRDNEARGKGKEKERNEDRDQGRELLPGVFKAAGLMVPEPSIRSEPMPFIGAETVYMVGDRREVRYSKVRSV